MSDISDLFNSLDASDLDEIAGKLKVNPISEGEDCECEHEKENKKKLDKIPAQLDKSTKKHAKQAKDLRAAGIGEQIEDLFSNYEVPKTAVSIPAPQKVRLPQQQQTSRRDALIENAARAISHVAKKDAKVESKPLREDRSIEDRMKLLEQDLFRVQAQATPNTLVAGIGASLDSGGGAVWLWDLEDVNIGVPYTDPTTGGTKYPNIANGSSLVYKSATGKWEATVISGGASGTVYTENVFLSNPVTQATYESNLQTLPSPGGDVDTQDDANQWFKASLLDIDERLGGIDGNTDVPGNLDFEDTDNVAAIRRFNANVPTLQIQIGNTVASVETTTEFLKGSTTSLVPLSVSPAASNTVAGTVDLLSIGKTNQDSSQVKVFNVSIDETEVLNKATFVRPTGGGISGFNIQGVVDGTEATTGNLFYVDQSTDPASNPDAIKYYGAITDENDIVTKKYVDSSTGGSTAGVTKIIAGSNVSISPESGIGEVTIDATGSGSGGWSLTGDTALTGACDIELTASNNALRFLNTSNGVMMRLMNEDNKVEFNSLADFNQGLELASGKDITLAGGGSKLLMRDGQGTAFELSDDGNNIFLRANTAGTPGFTFYQDLMSQNDAVRCKFQAYEPPGGSHFYLQTTDADALDFVDSDTNEIYLRFNTNAKALQIADADVELDVTGTTNTGRLETLNWYVENGLGVADAGHIYIQDDDGAAFDIQNTAGGNPHLRFKTTDSAEATLFYYPIQTSNASLILGSDGTITTSATATFNGAIVHDPSSNAAVDFGAYDGSSARSMVRFNRRLANTAGQADLVVRGYREGENTVKDIFQVKNNNPATEGDEILYYGETDNDDFAIQTKKSVAALIDAGGGGISFTFKGTTDATATNPPSAVAGDYYLNSVAGTVGSGWGGIAGITVALNQMLIYKADGNWITGGGAAAFLPLSGGTVTGATTFEDALTAEGVVTLQGEATSTAGIVVDRTSAPNNILDIKQGGTRTAQIVANGNAQFAATTTTGTLTIGNTGDTNALIIKDGSTTTAQIFKGGSATFNGAVTAPAFKLTDNSKFIVANTGATTVTGLTCNGAATISTSLGVVGAFTANSTSLFQGGAITVEVSAPLTVNSQSRFKTYPLILEDGFSAGILGTGADCSINGDLTIEDPSTSSHEGAIILKAASGTEQARLSATQLATQKRFALNGSQVNQAIRAEGNAAKTLTFAVSNATGGSAADNTFQSVLVLAKELVKFPRLSSNGVDFRIEGQTSDAPTVATGELVNVNRNASGTADALNYYGRTEGDNNVQTLTSVNALIAASGGGSGANILSGGTVKNTGGSASTSGNLAVQATGSGGGSLFIRNSSGNDIHSLNANGTAILGSVLELGSTNANQATKAINLLGTSQPTLAITTQAIGGSAQEIVSFANNQTFFQTALKVGPVGGASNYLLTTDGKVQTDGALQLTGNQNQTSAGTPALSSDNNLIYFNTSQTGKAFFVKTGGTNSSSNPNNHMYFYCGSTSTTSNVGIRNPILTLGNQNGTYVASLGASNATDSIRQQYENEVVIMKTLATTTLRIESPTTTTATETDTEGEVRNTITQTAATVPSNVTFTGNNIHSGTVTHNADFTVGTNHIISLSSPVFQYNGHYAFSGSTSNTLIQKIRNNGQANKVLQITATDAGNTEQNILNLAYAENKFYTPLAITKLAPYNVTGTGIDEVLEINGASQYKNIYVTGSSSTGHRLSFGLGESTNAIYTVLELEHQSPIRAQYGLDASTSKVINVATPTDANDAATKSYVDNHSNGISGGQQSGTWTATFSGDSGSVPSSGKQTATGHYRKIGDLTHVTLSVTGLNLTGYAGAIRIEGLPFKPDMSIAGGTHIGKIHAVNFMVNNYHADDGFVSAATHDSTHGSHIAIFSEQVSNLTHYITNTTNASVIISITYIAE